MSDKRRVKIIKCSSKSSRSGSGKQISSKSLSDVGSSLNECLFDKDLAYTKFEKMIRIVEQFSQVLQSVRDSKMFSQIESPKSKFVITHNLIMQFIRDSCQTIYGIPNIPDVAPPLSSLRVALNDQFQQIYENIRGAQPIKIIIQSCDKLTPYKNHIEKLDALDGHFLEKLPGVSFCPFVDFDVKDAYLQNQQKNMRDFLLIYLNKIYTYGYRLYCEYTSPDMNVDQMASIVTNSLGQLRHIPQLSRCKLAFDMIEKNISMLQDRFGEYYTDFLQSRNSSSIFENFIIDVAKSNKERKSSAVLTHQFNEIIKYYREIARQQEPNPQAEMLFNQFSRFNDQLGLHNLGSKSSGSTRQSSASASRANAAANAAPKTPENATLEQEQSRASANDAGANAGVDSVNESAADPTEEKIQTRAELNQ